ncbi:MAG: hypothetical protein IJ191_03230 [Treponema sp.]|nr:hypothetical protein [Treponema sp.]
MKLSGMSIALTLLPVATLAVLFFFRSAPAGRLWDSYRVLAVDAATDDAVVQTALSDVMCQGVISLAGQQLPLGPAGNAVTVSFIRSDRSESASYLSGRTRYFFDRSGRTRLYYVPVAYERQLARAVVLLAGQGIAAAVDVPVRFPWLPPVCALLFAALAGFVSRRRSVFLSVVAFFVLFAFSVPSYGAAAAVCLVLPAVWVVCECLYRDDVVSVVFKTPLVVTSGTAVVIAGAVSRGAGGMFLLTGLAAGTVLYAVRRRVGMRAAPSGILPAVISLARDRRLLFLLSASGVCTGALALCFLGSARFVPSSNGAEFPSRAARFGEQLPGLDAYVSWRWHVETFPYRSLTVPPQSATGLTGETIVFPDYAKNSTLIHEAASVRFTFDAAYRGRCIAAIDELEFDAIEQLFKAEDLRGTAGYAATGAAGGGVKTAILLLCALCAAGGTGIWYRGFMRTVRSVPTVVLRRQRHESVRYIFRKGERRWA